MELGTRLKKKKKSSHWNGVSVGIHSMWNIEIQNDTAAIKNTFGFIDRIKQIEREKKR